MFGYVSINKQELKLKDYETYLGYYCGLCSDLHKRYGRIGQFLLNYDMTFLVILLTGLYEPKEIKSAGRCIPHPLQKHGMVHNEYTEYAADMTVLLAYQKAVDDWRDEKSKVKGALAVAMRQDYRRVRMKYPRQAKTLEQCVRLLSEAEQQESEDLDYVAGLTGRFLGEMFVWQEDLWQEQLRSLGFYLGKFVYLMDAFEDREKDQKKGNYNIFLNLSGKRPDTFAKEAEGILVDMMSCCSREFEKLPILKNADILRNILYSGVWCKYALIQEKQNKKEGKAAADKKTDGQTGLRNNI